MLASITISATLMSSSRIKAKLLVVSMAMGKRPNVLENTRIFQYLNQIVCVKGYVI